MSSCEGGNNPLQKLVGKQPRGRVAETAIGPMVNGSRRVDLVAVPGKGYFAILRLYGPTEAALNKNWKPGDFEKVK